MKGGEAHNAIISGRLRAEQSAFGWGQGRPMKLDEDLKERIRRSYYLERKSIRQIAREEGYSRPTIEKAITNQSNNPYHVRRPKPSPIFGPYQPRVEALLLENDHLPRKQCYTVHRIFEVIRAEGYQESRIPASSICVRAQAYERDAAGVPSP